MKTDNYHELVDRIHRLEIDGVLSAVNASKLNGMKPPLYNRYRILPKQVDLSHLKDEINYQFPIHFNRSFYLSNLKRYKQDKPYIQKLIQFYRNKQEELKIPMSINERSFSIFGEEKFLKNGSGQMILKNLGLELNTLNIYLTPEPFVYFSKNKNYNQTVLIIENKDTWYTIRRLMIEGKSCFLGVNIDTVIYGAGKRIEKSLEEYEYTVEEYLLEPKQMLYWGDFDYEGILIYERLVNRYRNKFVISLFKEAYLHMMELSQSIQLPASKEKQNHNIGQLFLNELKPIDDRIIQVLEQGYYIPQEIINYKELSE